jgi:hypothetical protein
VKPALLPPQNLWLSLPALTPDEAEMILNLVDELHRLLWEAYGDVVIPNLADKNAPWEAHDQGDHDDDGM